MRLRTVQPIVLMRVALSLNWSALPGRPCILATPELNSRTVNRSSPSTHTSTHSTASPIWRRRPDSRCATSGPTRSSGSACSTASANEKVTGTLFGRYEFLRCGRPAGEEEFLHLCLEELPGLGLDRRQAVLIDQHCLVTQPALPRLPGNVVVDTLPKYARVRRIVEAFRLFTQQDTFNRA